jgi:Uma2 family endonuclease
MSVTQLITFAEFEELPDEPGKRELIDGEVISMPPPELSHTELMKVIYDVLRRTLDRSRVWPDHTGYRIGGGWIEPDVSVSWPDQPRDDKYFLRSPMIAVEILSPGEEIERKLTLYFAEGAAEVWILDPRRKAMTVYARRKDDVVRVSVAELHYSEAIQCSISLAEMFA